MKFLICLCVGFAFAAVVAEANFVSYVDENGTRHIVQSAEDIPEQYREKAKESAAGDPSNVSVARDTASAPSTESGNKKGRGRGRKIKKGASDDEGGGE